MSDTVLVDTGAWIALFDESAVGHEAIAGYAEVIETFPLIVPWPILYETLRTRLTRRPTWVTAFNSLVSRPDVTLADDSAYRDDAFSLTVEFATRHKRDISMVDMMCRLLIEDPEVKVDYLITPNKKDFVDVCSANGVEILP